MSSSGRGSRKVSCDPPDSPDPRASSASPVATTDGNPVADSRSSSAAVIVATSARSRTGTNTDHVRSSNRIQARACVRSSSFAAQTSTPLADVLTAVLPLLASTRSTIGASRPWRNSIGPWHRPRNRSVTSGWTPTSSRPSSLGNTSTRPPRCGTRPATPGRRDHVPRDPAAAPARTPPQRRRPRSLGFPRRGARPATGGCRAPGTPLRGPP